MTEPQTIFLIGTKHIYQTQGKQGPEWCKPGEGPAFKDFLLKMGRRYRIKTLVEELNRQALKEHREELMKIKKEFEGYKTTGLGMKALEEERKIALDQMEETIKRWVKDKSIPQEVAKELPCKYLFCDPDSKQRDLLGIEDADRLDLDCFFEGITSDEAERRKNESWTKRESYWLEQLQKEVSESEYPVLLICGAKHVDTFSKLLEENDFNVTCICKDWEPSIPTENK